MKSFSEEIIRLSEGDFLEESLISDMVDSLSRDEFEQDKIGDWLLAMNNLVPESPKMGEFLANLANSLRAHSIAIAPLDGEWADCCGTGGGAASFNVSTAGAILASSAGLLVAKHGNRGVTSSCGSADILESLGVKIDHFDPVKVEKIGLGFLFAPSIHPIFAKLGPVRKSLGVRTIFNVMGPLLNPLRPQIQVIGVYDSRFVLPIAEASNLLGNRATLVVHGALGEDEVSAAGTSMAVLASNSQVKNKTIHPDDFGLMSLLKLPKPPVDLEHSVAAFKRAISDIESPEWHMAAMTAATLIWLKNPAVGKIEAMDTVRRVTEKGKPLAKLEALIS